MQTWEYSNRLENKLIREFIRMFAHKTGKVAQVLVESDTEPIITLEELLAIVNTFIPNHIKHRSIKVKSRKQPIIHLRQMFYKLAYKPGLTSLEMIGEFMNHADHTTVRHAIKRFQDLYDTDEDYNTKFKNIQLKIKQYTNDGTTIPTDHQGKPDTQPGVSDAELEGERVTAPYQFSSGKPHLERRKVVGSAEFTYS